MDLRSLDCPDCGSNHQYFLSVKTDTHLRQCPECASWFLVHGESEDAGDTGGTPRPESLGRSTECPVAGCNEELSGDEVAAHIVERHGGSLAPPSG